MNSDIAVSEDGLRATVEFKDFKTDKIYVLSLNLLVHRQSVLVSFKVGDKNKILMEFPAHGSGRERVTKRMKRNETMRFVTQYADEKYGHRGSAFVTRIAYLINKARLEMLRLARN